MSTAVNPKADTSRPPHYGPAAVLATAKAARTLTVSDQHANILLTVAAEPSLDGSSNAKEEKQALLKLTIVPFHKTDLARLQETPLTEDDERNLSEKEFQEKKALREEQEKEHSTKVLKFLSKFDWRCTSESGEEYSYHEAFPKLLAGHADEVKEPAPKRVKTGTKEEEPFLESKPSTFKAELIYPASERQVSRAMPSPGMAMVFETPEMYDAVTKPFIESVVASGSISWLKNIVEIKKEKERLLHNGEGWILNIDTKWRTHPDALTVPRSEWYKHESVEDLYCLGIVKADGIATLRDLTEKHLPVLRDMLKEGPRIIEQVYGVKEEQLRIFVHYQPQFYHFHVHFTRLHNDTGAQVEKAHLLLDVIQDLEADPDCLKKKTLTYKLSLKNELYKLLTVYGNGDGEGAGNEN